MISVQEATLLIQSQTLPVPVVEVPISQANGKVLREPLYADRDFPPFHRVTMDGIAVAFAQLERGQQEFVVAGTQFAGMPLQTLQDPAQCLEVMTGAILPAGTDTVIRYEDLQLENPHGQKLARILILPEKKGQNIHFQGTDQGQGDLLIPVGTRLGPAEIGVAAAVGKSRLRVSASLKIAVVSTGDELVEIDQTPLPHQIRRSNAYMLGAALQEAGASPELFHVPDDKAVIKSTLSQLLATFDGLVLSGGVSMGQSDFVPEVLQELGVQAAFHKVAQKPGKPFWFGKSTAGKVVFAFPGNPVSTFLCFYRYLLPWLQTAMQMPLHPTLTAILTETIHFKPPLTYFIPVATRVNEKRLLTATPLPGSGSGDFANLLQADAFLELPASQSVFPIGEGFPLIRFRH